MRTKTLSVKAILLIRGWGIREGAMEKEEVGPESFSQDEVIAAIRSFIEHGEVNYGKCHQGYLSNSGFAARVLKYHLKQLEGGFMDGT